MGAAWKFGAVLTVALVAWTSTTVAQAPNPAPPAPPPPSDSADLQFFARAAKAAEERDKLRPKAVKPLTREQAGRSPSAPAATPR